jgi:uncharacterized protein YdiU (UPF0061 family)
MMKDVALESTYAELPERFYTRMAPTPVAQPRLIALNEALAGELGLDPATLASEEGTELLAGNRVAAESRPLAMAYAGHQFGNFVPQLGDGRAILLGEVVDREGRRRDIQLKGSGPTPYSRSGDGRAALGPVLREYIVSEAMAALGIPTTRSLAAVMTGERVFRETILPGAILTRVASSHVRVGTFQYFLAQGDGEAVRVLADYVIQRHYPDAAESAEPYLELLNRVIAAQAALIAKWMNVGFIHGVMNTDNSSVAGETIDYGPCAFMDAYDPATVFSSIDMMGRYAYQNQPGIAQWNLACLAQSLLHLLDRDETAAIGKAQAAIDAFPDLYAAAWLEGMRAKLGLTSARDDDKALAEDLLQAMAANGLDFTNTFRGLGALADPDGAPGADAIGWPDHATRLPAEWIARWRARLAGEDIAAPERQARMERANPRYIPRNHRVEAALKAAMAGDLGPFETLNKVLARPFEDQPEHAAYTQPPAPDEVVRATFCGT